MGRSRTGLGCAMLALVPLALASACGGESEADKAKRYRAKATAICQQLDREVGEIVHPIADAEVAAFVDRRLAVATAAANRLRRLTPPKNLARLHRSALATIDRQRQEVERTRQNRRRLTLKGLLAPAPRIVVTTSGASPDFVELGLPSCADAGTRLSPAQRYRTDVASICAQTARPLDRLRRRKPASVDEAIRLGTQLDQVIARFVRRLGRLHPPSDLAARHRRFVAVFARVRQITTTAVRDLDAGRPDAAQAAAGRLDRLERRGRALSGQLHVAC